MPGRDGTGPMGRGALTGRGLGNCKSDKTVLRQGLGFGRGRGLGRRCFNFYPYQYDVNDNIVDDLTVIDEKATLKKQAEYYENELKLLKEKLKKIDDEKKINDIGIENRCYIF